MHRLPGETTLAELHEIKAKCIECCTLDGCDTYCEYWRFNADGYACAFGLIEPPHTWTLPNIIEMED